MAVRKNREVKNPCVIEQGSVSGDYKDGFMSKYNLNRYVKSS